MSETIVQLIKAAIKGELWIGQGKRILGSLYRLQNYFYDKIDALCHFFFLNLPLKCPFLSLVFSFFISFLVFLLLLFLLISFYC